MLRPKHYQWKVHIGSWSLTQWLKYVVVIAAFIVAANYIAVGPHRPRDVGGTGANKITDVSELYSRVVFVVDGDTLDVLRNDVKERIRLNGIDCPEIRQAYGDQAKRFAAELSLNKRVMVKTHGKDKYGRILGDVILDDGRVLNRELVKAGLAWWYWKYSNDTDLSELEQRARSDKVGLWADSNAIPPWEFRALQKHANGNTQTLPGQVPPVTSQ